MKKNNMLITAFLVVLCAIPSAYGSQKKCYPFWVDFGDDKTTPMQVTLEQDNNDDVAIHFAKASGWLVTASNEEYFDNQNQPVATVSPNNKVDIELQVKAHSAKAHEILNNVVTNHKELIGCLKNSPNSTEDVDTCIDLYVKTFHMTNFSRYPAGSKTPDEYKAFVNDNWNEFAKVANNFEVSAHKESDQIASFKMSCKVNTKEVAAKNPSDEKRNGMKTGFDLIDPAEIFYLTLVNQDLIYPEASVRLTKFEVTNNETDKVFTYAKDKMQ